MAVRNLPLFVLVAFLWGVPYLLISVSLTGFDAPFVVWTRVALAALVLIAVVGPRTLVRALRGRVPVLVGFALIQFTLPLVLIAEAEQTVPSSLVGCLIASEPLWIALLAARVDRNERTPTAGTVGLVVGLVGVAVLLGAKPAGGLGGATTVLMAAASYALATLVIPRLAKDVPVLHLVTVGLTISALTLLPWVLLNPPSQVPGVRPVVALVTLAVVCTAFAFPLWFSLIARIGAAQAGLVTYVSPIVAVALGIVVLGEQPGALAPVGLVLIVAGSWAASRAKAATTRRAPVRRAA